ncbi:MAG TPA: thioredoxin fold domain-containing protein [Pyrinomonadaceae bacterium]|nr:thioredoxin fold domain-containing protein [Pyrinomonadaceae bacterium]
MDIALLAIRLILFGVFAVAGISKILDRKGSEKALADFGIPGNAVGFLVVILPIFELIVAAGLLLTSTSWFGAAGSLVLLLCFTGGMIVQMAKGRAPDCHCFGQLHSEPVGLKSLLRNVVLVLLAAILLGSGRNYQGMEIAASRDDLIQTASVLWLIAIAIVLLGYLVKLSRKQEKIEMRLSLIGPDPIEGSSVERNEAGDPSDGLPIGAPLPIHELIRLDETSVSVTDLLDSQKPKLFLFVGANCAPCEGLMPEIEEWEQELSGRLQFVFVSHGSIKENGEKFGRMDRSVYIENDRALAMSVNAKWTPTALLVDAKGNIASHIAAGDVAIRRLIEQIKVRDLEQEFTYFLGMNGHRRPNIGEAIPEFSLTDISGKEIKREDLIGRRTLIAFSSPTCGHCARLMKQIKDWEAIRNEGDPQMLIFTDGEAEQEQKLGLSTPMISDKDYRNASRFGMRGVPSAVLVDETGTIITEAAIGPDNIWALIGRKPPRK